MRINKPTYRTRWIICHLLISALCACSLLQTTQPSDLNLVPQAETVVITPAYPTATPSAPRILPTLRTEAINYSVQSGDTLRNIARTYGVHPSQIIAANNIPNPDVIHVGENIIIPPPQPSQKGTDFKIIPDAELVYSPTTINFDVIAFVKGKNGYLNNYTEEVNGEIKTASDIVILISKNYSVNPRLLLAFIEYKTNWVTQTPEGINLDYPLVAGTSNAIKGLYRELSWVADSLNLGYYLWQINALSSFILEDGTVILPDPTINAGTAAVQYLFSNYPVFANWSLSVSSDGLYKTYISLFGDPFFYSIEPLLPLGLSQPGLLLPFETGVTWYFTGGPHGGWDNGSAWAALDFAPPGETLGCVTNDNWVTAVADGYITRSDSGIVIQDLDQDQYEQTGWSILYLHVESRERIPANVNIKAGEHIGHPSCEGGASSGTHVHIARRYNGEWISADGSIPFNLSGWVSSGEGIAYNGYLKNNSQVCEAWYDRRVDNEIYR